LRKITILVSSSPSLARVIEHLFRGRPEFEIIGNSDNLGSLGQQAGRLLPDLIVANVKPVSIGIRRAVTSIKQSSPLSKLILICPLEDLSRVARQSGADAYLKDEKLTSHLLRMAHTLSDRPAMANAGD
jgi:chemotaxis response regulator CheB